VIVVDSGGGAVLQRGVVVSGLGDRSGGREGGYCGHQQGERPKALAETRRCGRGAAGFGPLHIGRLRFGDLAGDVVVHGCLLASVVLSASCGWRGCQMGDLGRGTTRPSVGPVEAAVDGRPVALDGQPPQALVALLALIGGCVVCDDRLVGRGVRLWWRSVDGKRRVRGVRCPFAVRRIVIGAGAPYGRAAMESLCARDLEGALRFVREASDETGSEPFPVHVLEGLRGLVGCELVTYSELDGRHRRQLGLIASDGSEGQLPDEEAKTFWHMVDQHPLCRAQRRGRFDALKLSDFHSRRELHSLEIYADLLRPWGVEFELEVAIPSPVEHSKTFLFDDARHDFDERDRALLNLLQPHFVQLHRAAAVRRVADGARAVLEDGRDLGKRGLLVLDAQGTIDMASPIARRLLDRYVADRTGARLPAALARWLEEQRTVARAGRASAALSIDGPSGTLVIHLDRRGATEVMVLEERTALDGAAAALSSREREVLALVAEGLRNAEIAETLWVSPATVRKHLENIYEKLDVHTRTAAVARAHAEPKHVSA
jgi:DNA-binding CsgD family transcriptional regulator